MNDPLGLQGLDKPRAEHIARANKLQRECLRMCEGLPYDAALMALTHALGVMNVNAATTSDAARRNTNAFCQKMLDLVDRADADGAFEERAGDDLRTWDYGADIMDLAAMPCRQDDHRRAIWEVVHQLPPGNALTMLLGIVMAVSRHAIPVERRAEFFASLGPTMEDGLAQIEAAVAERTYSSHDTSRDAAKS